MQSLKKHPDLPEHGPGDNDIVDRLKSTNPFDFPMMKISRRVCLIRRDDGTEATGFLVGPELMLTTAHALLGTSGIFADPEQVTILFDQFIWNKKTATKAFGAQCKLRHIPFTRQPDVLASSIKTDPKSKRRVPVDGTDDNGLDYVLVRLDQPVGLMYLPFSHRLRGWNNCSKAGVSGPLRVVQHPLGGLQEFADGTIDVGDLKDDEFPQFFKYKTITLNGSSGAPIHNEYDNVVGMHVGERKLDEKRSEQLGVSFQDIAADLEKQGVTLPSFNLEKETMDTLFGSSKVERDRYPGRDESKWRGDRLFD